MRIDADRGSVKTFPDKERTKTSGFIEAQAARSRSLATERRSNFPEALFELFRDWQRTQTQSSAKAFEPEAANGCPVLLKCRGHQP